MLTARTIFGAMWSMSARFLGRMVDFAVLLVLARLLAPADFGLTALAVSLVVVVETLLDVPLIQALTGLPAVRRTHLDTAFTIALMRAAAIVAALGLAAWPLSRFYGDPALVPLVLFLSIGPAARGLLSPRMVEPIRAMRFRPVFVMEVTGKIAAAAATLAVAFAGGGHWAIATNSVVSASVAALASYALAPYRPGLSLREWTEFRAFVGWISLSQIVASLNWQFDRIVLGRFVPTATLGQYTTAGDVAVLPTQTLVSPAMSPLVAALGSIGDDPARLRAAYLKAARFVMMATVPASAGIALTADVLAPVLLGPGWALAGTYLAWFSLTTLLAAYYQPLAALSLIVRRTDAMFKLGLVDFALRAATIPPLIWSLLVPGAILGRGVVALVVFGLTLVVARRLSGAGIAEQLLNLWKVGAATLAMAAGVFLFREAAPFGALPAILDLGLSAALGMALYGAALLGLGLELRLADLRPAKAR